MSQPYDDRFFSYTDQTASRSARIVVPLLQSMLKVDSVIDVGCGRGAWLAAWRAYGVTEIYGVDGSYIDRDALLFDPSRFASHDLNSPIHRDRNFDLVQSLEVAEHLEKRSAEPFIESLVGLGDVILFSAAVPGQGGAHHINERPLEYWRALFESHGYAAFDALRPALSSQADVEPWYRYNLLLYANQAGISRLASVARAGRVDAGVRLAEGGDLHWRVRRTILRPLPVAAVTWIAMVKSRVSIR